MFVCNYRNDGNRVPRRFRYQMKTYSTDVSVNFIYLFMYIFLLLCKNETSIRQSALESFILQYMISKR